MLTHVHVGLHLAVIVLLLLGGCGESVSHSGPAEAEGIEAPTPESVTSTLAEGEAAVAENPRGSRIQPLRLLHRRLGNPRRSAHRPHRSAHGSPARLIETTILRQHQEARPGGPGLATGRRVPL